MTHDLKTSLDRFAESAYADAPPTTVDIGKARTEGRRRMLTARLASVGGGVAVVAACALVVTTLGGTSPAGEAGPGGAARRTFTGTDPLVSPGTFGWLPDGLRVGSYSAGPDYGDSLTAFLPHTAPETSRGPGSTPVSEPRLVLMRWATEPNRPEYRHKTEVAVRGAKKAFLATNPASAEGIPADLSLIWQTESGSWYTLGGDYAIHGDELKALLIKVAEAVRTEQTPVAMPFHIEGLPKDLSLGTALLNLPGSGGGHAFDASVTYHAGNGDAAAGYFSVTAMSAADRAQPDPSPAGVLLSGTGLLGAGSATVDPSSGAPLTGMPKPPTTVSACKDSDGVHLCVQDTLTQDGKDVLAGVGGAQGLLNRITSLGTDRANWTADVVN